MQGFLGVILAGMIWLVAALLCAKYRSLAPSLFLLIYGYKDVLIGFDWVDSGGLSDPVLHVSLWAAFAILYDLIGRYRWRCFDWVSIVCFLLLACWMITSLAWTRAPEYGAYKAYRFAAFGGLCYLSGMLVRNEFEYRQMVWFLALGALPLAFIILVFPTISDAGRATLYGGGTLNAALALATPATVIFVLANNYSSVQRSFLYGTAIVLTAAIIPTGSRAFFAMPFLSLTFAQLVRSGSRADKTIRLVALLGVLAALSTVGYDLGRAGRIDIDQAARADHWAYTFRGASESFFGYGCGDFGYAFNGFDARGFPHNFLLEAWYELGLPGLALYLLWWLRPLELLWTRRKRIQSFSVTQAKLASQLVAVFSITSIGILPHFDLADNRALYVAMGLAVGVLHQSSSTARANSRERPFIGLRSSPDMAIGSTTFSRRRRRQAA